MAHKLKVVMASDHVGYHMKRELKQFMEELGHNVDDIGAAEAARAEYPTYGRMAADAVALGKYDIAVLVCGTGFGISLAANSVAGVRCVNCTDAYTTRMSRLHNNANAIAFGARVIAPEYAKELLYIWLTTEFEGGRHATRVDMLCSMSNVPQAGEYSVQPEGKS